MNSAVLLASKSKVMKTVTGETIRGIGVSFTDLIKRSKIKNIDDYVFILKDFIRTINLSREVEQEIEELTTKFSFLLKIYNKYEKIFKKLQFQPRKKREKGEKKLDHC